MPDGVYAMNASTTENALVALTTTETSKIYVYKYHMAGREKMQSAWFKYTFNGLEILNAAFIESALYVVGNKSGKTLLFKMQFDEGRSDVNQTYVTRLDFRLTEAECTRSYDAGTNLTTITTPFTLATPFVVTRGANSGEILAVTGSGASFTVTGDKTATEFYVGERYTMTYEFSEPTLKEPTSGGGRVAIAGGRLQIKHWILRFQESGFFNVEVSNRITGSSATTHTFTGRLIGGGSNIIGSTKTSSGDFRFPVMIKANNAVVKITSDSHLPCQFLSAEWEGNMHLRSRRVSG